jgi:hypothetical protein
MLKVANSVISASRITGTLPVVNGGTGVTTSTGTGNTVLSASPTLSGNVTLSTGNLIVASGQGIDFSATSGTGTSELLDDYEEGSFTPVLSDASTGGNVATIPVKSAYYTKIGRLVTFTIQLVNIDTTGMTAGNQIFIQSLPFKVADLPSSYSYPVAYSQNNMSSTTGSLAFICSFNSTYIYVVNLTTTGASNATVSQLTSGTAQIFLNGSYFVD